MIVPVLIAIGVIVAVSILVGLLLGFVAGKFRVETDTREPQVRECLAGSNCGGCGYAGCDAYAHAIVCEGANPGLCPASDRTAIGEIMGVAVGSTDKYVAFVGCSGDCNRAKHDYFYRDIDDCRIAYFAPGHGDKTCIFGCCGFGSCAKVCPYDAIRIVNGVAVVDREKCRACGKCVTVCPNHIIKIVPDTQKYIVRCSSPFKGKDVKNACDAGCIGCGMCARQCEFGAVKLENNLAVIDPALCVGCGKCAVKCPVKVIVKRG